MFDEKRKAKNNHTTDSAERFLRDHPIDARETVKLPQGSDADEKENSKVGPLAIHNAEDDQCRAEQARDDALGKVVVFVEGGSH